MSAETTPAIERGTAVGPGAHGTAVVDPTIPHVWRHVAGEVLAVALDVEEMARAVLPYIGTFEGLAPVEQDFRRGIARNLRAAILGAAS